MSETVLQDKWSLSIVFVGFETFCQKIWNRKKTYDNVHWNMWMTIKKLYAGNIIFNKRIPNMRFLNHLYYGPIFVFWETALRRFNQCFFFNFSLSVNHGGQHFYSAPPPRPPPPSPTIKKLPTALPEHMPMPKSWAQPFFLFKKK